MQALRGPIGLHRKRLDRKLSDLGVAPIYPRCPLKRWATTRPTWPSGPPQRAHKRSHILIGTEFATEFGLDICQSRSPRHYGSGEAKSCDKCSSCTSCQFLFLSLPLHRGMGRGSSCEKSRICAGSGPNPGNQYVFHFDFGRKRSSDPSVDFWLRAPPHREDWVADALQCQRVWIRGCLTCS